MAHAWRVRYLENVRGEEQFKRLMEKPNTIGNILKCDHYRSMGEVDPKFDSLRDDPRFPRAAADESRTLIGRFL